MTLTSLIIRDIYGGAEGGPMKRYVYEPSVPNGLSMLYSFPPVMVNFRVVLI